nr:MAG TPA: hypothetical protein [Caudoviricetes sp.]
MATADAPRATLLAGCDRGGETAQIKRQRHKPLPLRCYDLPMKIS